MGGGVVSMIGWSSVPWRPLLIAVLAFVSGWGASVVRDATAPLHLSGHLMGTVSVVNQDGAKACLDPDGGGPRRCGAIYQRVDAPTLAVGDHVRIGVGLLRLDDGSRAEIFVLEAPE